ncbi:ABATE domain-containing protein [Streptomyces sp. NBRC 109706]|uniref:CGNR zinc finger domain-containing protein n=1 Tax=Streptomyces sp. NBRC 109706 TaxID=1550035 RepID=UPI000781A494|nr:ABATE domain-containing protein [Streptomyces sp. NBRC 109706]
MEFAFVSGDPALDLVATVESRRGAAVDLLAAPEDLERWIRACDGLPDEVAVDAASFAAALRLREAIYRLTLERLRGDRFTPAGLAVVNGAAAGPALGVELSDAGLRLSGGADAVLAQLARQGITLLADRLACLKECGRADCTRVYLDRSRGGRRTWCGMDACGNRVKAAAYRARRRAAREEPDPG